MFLEYLFRKAHFDQSDIRFAQPMDVIGNLSRIQSVSMDSSSWGENGYSDVWLNSSNEWVYKHLMECSISIHELASIYKGTEDDIKRRILNQMGREALLLQSSDWPFIMKTGTVVQYAEKRVRVHTNLFQELKEMLISGNVNEDRLKHIEEEHPIFPELNFEIFC